jgi:hypothetical protein
LFPVWSVVRAAAYNSASGNEPVNWTDTASAAALGRIPTAREVRHLLILHHVFADDSLSTTAEGRVFLFAAAALGVVFTRWPRESLEGAPVAEKIGRLTREYSTWRLAPGWYPRSVAEYPTIALASVHYNAVVDGVSSSFSNSHVTECYDDTGDDDDDDHDDNDNDNDHDHDHDHDDDHDDGLWNAARCDKAPARAGVVAKPSDAGRPASASNSIGVRQRANLNIARGDPTGNDVGEVAADRPAASIDDAVIDITTSPSAIAAAAAAAAAAALEASTTPMRANSAVPRAATVSTIARAPNRDDADGGCDFIDGAADDDKEEDEDGDDNDILMDVLREPLAQDSFVREDSSLSRDVSLNSRETTDDSHTDDDDSADAPPPKRSRKAVARVSKANRRQSNRGDEVGGGGGDDDDDGAETRSQRPIPKLRRSQRKPPRPKAEPIQMRKRRK